jgi:hypothetical protein
MLGGNAKTMIYKALADAVVLLHLAFILFAVFGGLLAMRRPWLALIHLPIAAWAAFIELTGRVCPLTPLENRLRYAAGQAGYQGGFVDHYIARLIYPPGLNRNIELVLGALVIIWNGVVYALVLQDLFRRR